MTLDTLIMLSGGFVAVLPLLGFPNSWDNVLFFLAGIFVIALGIVVRRRGLASEHKNETAPKAGNHSSDSPVL
jgi:hypothetical protein